MEHCDYCGKESESGLMHSADCAIALTIPGKPEAGESRALNAAWATFMLAPSLLMCVCLGIFVGIGGYAIDHGSAKSVQNVIRIKELMPVIGLALEIVVYGAVVLMSLALFPKYLKDSSTTGAAWVVGSRRNIFLGMIIGATAAVSFFPISTVLSSGIHGAPNLVAKIFHIPRLWFILTAIVTAPIGEELLFRGIIYGGYRRSFGPFWAAILTTSIFVVLHFSVVIHSPSRFCGIIALGIVTLWLRLRASAIGPAIAAHSAYNSAIVLLTIYTQK